MKAIIFDADGVIINKPHNFSEKYMRDFGISNEDMLPFFKHEFGKAIVGEADLKQIVSPYLKNWRWEKSVDEFLQYWFEAEHFIDKLLVKDIEQLRLKGIKIYLATNQEEHRVRYIENEMGIGNHVDYVFSSARLNLKKPNREFYQKVHAHIGDIPASEIYFFDDDEENVQGARDYGFKSFHYKTRQDFLNQLTPQQQNFQ